MLVCSINLKQNSEYISMNPRIYNKKLTVIIVSFHSNHIIENLINVLEKNIKIIVIENSLDNKLKINLEKKFENVQVVIPKKNLGNGGGINLGLSLAKTESIRFNISSLLESNIGRLYYLHLCAALQIKDECGIATNLFFESDLCNFPSLENGRVNIDNSFGIGINEINL